jgi:hypothetical protein
MPWAIRSLDFIDADALNTAFNQHTREIAGVIIEPVQVRNGLVADDEYLELARQLCDRHGALLIYDEIETGFARTRQNILYQWSGVVRDMVMSAKASSGGICCDRGDLGPHNSPGPSGGVLRCGARGVRRAELTVQRQRAEEHGEERPAAAVRRAAATLRQLLCTGRRSPGASPAPLRGRRRGSGKCRRAATGRASRTPPKAPYRG